MRVCLARIGGRGVYESLGLRFARGALCVVRGAGRVFGRLVAVERVAGIVEGRTRGAGDTLNAKSHLLVGWLSGARVFARG